MAGVVVLITDLNDVPLMVARGYSSLSFLHSAAEQIDQLNVPAFIYPPFRRFHQWCDHRRPAQQ